MMKWVRVIVFAVFFIFSRHGLCVGLDMLFSNITVENGLSNNLVNTIYKDSLGFIWFGTLDGLDRYDGLEIRPYASKFPETVENVYAITEDYDRRLWVGTGTGLFRYNIFSDQFQKIQIDSTKIQVKRLTVLPDSSLLAGTTNGLYIFHVQRNSVEHILIGDEKNESQNSVTGVFPDNHGNCWISTLDGLVRYSWGNKRSELFRFNRAPEVASNSFTSICNIRNKIYLGTSNVGIVEFDLATKQFSKGFDIGNNIILTIHDDDKDQLFVGTNGGGLKVVNINSRQVETIENRDNDPASISSNSIYSFYLDENNKYWIGTYSGGINFSKSINGKFNLHSITTDYTDVNKSIRSFYFAPDGSQYFGTRNGLVFIDKNGNSQFYKASQGNKDGLRSNIILSVYPFQNEILIGTYGGGVSRLSGANHKIETLFDTEDFIKGNVYGFDTDKGGNLWIASFNGIYRYTPATKSVVNYNETNSSIPCDDIFEITFDSKGRLWLGTMKGVSLYIPNANKLDKVDLPATVESNFKVNYIYEDQAGNMWICTERGGLIMVDPNLEKSIVYHESDGLPDNSICAIIESSSGVYWISTLKGFCKFELQSDKFTQYSMSDGLPGLVFTPATTYVSGNGTIWFGNEKGLIYFSPEEVDKSFPDSKIRITDFYLFGKTIKPGSESILKQTIETTKEIILNDKSNSIGFRFTALNYLNPVDNHYWYKLEGYDNKWRDNGNNTSVYYQKLKSGHYTFKVRHANENDDSSSNIATVKINIKRSLLKSPVFFIVIIILAAEILFLLSNYIKSLKNSVRKMIEKKDVPEKYKGSKMTEDQSSVIVNDLKLYMEATKPYLNAELKLADLANEINYSAHDISQVLNQSLNLGFSDFVNGYRIEEVKKRLANKDYEKFTLYAIAQQCGFNSKTSFYRIFKNETGKTPSDYLKDLEQS